MRLLVDNLGANKTELTMSDDLVIFFSYHTPVAAIKDGNYYRTSRFHSITTTRHINEWLDGEIAISMPQEFFDKLVNI